MTQAKGVKAQLIGGVKEATFGTTPGTPSGIILPIISSAISSSQANITSNVIRGNRNAAAPASGNISVSGQVVAPLDLINIGYWLQMCFGDPTTTGTDPYTHVFTVGDSIDSWVLEQGYTDIAQYQEFNGCKCNSLSFSFDAGANSELTVSADIVGATETLGTSSIDASPTTQTFTRLEIGDLALTEGGSAIANVTKMDLTIGNNLDTSQYVVGGGATLGAISEGICQATGSITVLFENTTLLTKAKNSTETSIVATLTSGSYSLALDIGELLYDYKSPGIPGPQGILVNLPFSAYYDDDADASVVKATLVNPFASYPS